MPALEHVATCFSIAAACFMVAWPLWAIDETLSRVLEKTDSKRARRRIRSVANDYDISVDHLELATLGLRKRFEDCERAITDEETLALVLAALALSKAMAITVESALERITECHR